MDGSCRISAVLLAGLLCLSAGCSFDANGKNAKAAYIRYDEVAAVHPGRAKLKLGEAILRNLEGQELRQRQLLASQTGSLEELNRLRRASVSNFLAADLDAKLYEARQREAELLEKRLAAAEAEAEERVAQRRQEIEDDYRLRLFNLRLRLDNTRPLPREAAGMDRKELRRFEQEAKTKMEAKSAELKEERDGKIAAIEAEKAGYVRELMGPDVAAARERLAAEAGRGRAQMEAEMAAEADRKLPPEAEEALTQALTALDRQLTKQRMKNSDLRQKIDDDITSMAAKVAKEKGYAIVYKNIAAPGTAVDITDVLKTELAKLTSPQAAETADKTKEGR